MSLRRALASIATVVAFALGTVAGGVGTAVAGPDGFDGAPAPSSPTAGADPAGPIETADRWLVDDRGRVVITHGVNVVAKRAPFTPASLGFDTEDMDFLAAEGFDSVRLGIIWKGIEPEPGVYDDAYLAEIRDTIRDLHARGIRVLLDAHHDQYHERYEGHFAPDWAVTVDWPAEPRLGFPMNNMFQPALMRQNEDFLHNAPGPGGVGLTDRYAAMWKHVAGYFADEPGIMGYDMLNELFPGFNWLGCLTEIFCVEQNARLGEFNAKVGRAIREADPHTVVFYEPFPLNTSSIGVNAPAPGVPGQAMSFHSYCPQGAMLGIFEFCGPVEDNTIRLANERAARDNAPTLLTEFGAVRTVDSIWPVVRGSENHMIGWQYWAYCDCDDPATHGPGEQGIIDDARVPNPAAHADQAKLHHLAAPRPTALAGIPRTYGFDLDAGRFHLEWDAARAGGGPEFGPGSESIITVPRRHYPNGYDVHVEGARVVSEPGAQRLVLRADRGGHFSLTITRR